MSACDAALGFTQITSEDRSQLLAWRGVAHAFEENRSACESGSIAACDAALDSPAADAQASVLLRDWRANASPVNQVVEYVSTTVSGLPAVIYSFMALAMIAAGFAYRRRMPGAPLTVSCRRPQLIGTAYAQLGRQLRRATVHALVRQRNLASMLVGRTSSHTRPRDPVTALAALELAHAYLRDVQGGLGDVSGDPARQAQSLNDLSLASKQLTLAERADPTAVLSIEDPEGESHAFSLRSLKVQALFLEGVCRAETDPKRAIRILQQAVALEPTAADAHYWIGLINMIHMRRAQAVAALKTAVALEPKNLAYRKELGRAENISGAQIAFDRVATGARTTKRTLKWAVVGLIAILVISFIANVADPETRGPALFGLFAVLLMIGMLVSMVKTMWSSITGRE